MCLIALSWRAHPRYELALAANRDEFHHRPTAPAAWWADTPEVFGGRDLSQGGGWLAASRKRRLAAVTNVRRMVPPDPQSPSRGALVADFMRSTQSAAEFARRLRGRADAYAGFNLLLYDGDTLLYATNHDGFRSERLEPGIHAVSNATLDTPWPKLLRLRGTLQDWSARAQDDDDTLFAALADDRRADDAELPDTGVGLEMERFLSPPFIRGPHYGTRASSVIRIDGDGVLHFAERRFAANGAPGGETRESFTAPAST
ncbi:MAG: NRDE family protein [Nevskiaceae bacterium]|nr:MAG: NRDE family protein [Nevskiaceae bacterium]